MSPPAEFHVLAAVIERQMLQLLRWQDHAAVALLILKQRGCKHVAYQRATGFSGGKKITFVCGSSFFFPSVLNSVLTKQGCMFVSSSLCVCVCGHASRSEGVFLTSGLSGSLQDSSSKTSSVAIPLM